MPDAPLSDFAKEAKRALRELPDLREFAKDKSETDRVGLVKKLISSEKETGLHRLAQSETELLRLQETFVTMDHEKCNKSMRLFMGLVADLTQASGLVSSLKLRVVHLMGEMGSSEDAGYAEQMRQLCQRKARNDCMLQLVRTVEEVSGIDVSCSALRRGRNYLALAGELRRYDELLSQWPLGKDGGPELYSIHAALEERLSEERVSELAAEISQELADDVMRRGSLQRESFGALMVRPVAPSPPLRSPAISGITARSSKSVVLSNVPFTQGVPMWTGLRCCLRVLPAELEGGLLLRGPVLLPEQHQLSVGSVSGCTVYCVLRPGWRDGGLPVSFKADAWTCLDAGRPGGRIETAADTLEEEEPRALPPWRVFCKSIRPGGSLRVRSGPPATFFVVVCPEDGAVRRSCVAALHVLGTTGFPQRMHGNVQWAADTPADAPEAVAPTRSAPPEGPCGARWRLVEAMDELFDADSFRRRVVAFLHSFLDAHDQWHRTTTDALPAAGARADGRDGGAAAALAAERRRAMEQREQLEAFAGALFSEVTRIAVSVADAVRLVRERAYPFLDALCPVTQWEPEEQHLDVAPLDRVALHRMQRDLARAVAQQSGLSDGERVLATHAAQLLSSATSPLALTRLVGPHALEGWLGVPPPRLPRQRRVYVPAPPQPGAALGLRLGSESELVGAEGLAAEAGLGHYLGWRVVGCGPGDADPEPPCPPRLEAATVPAEGLTLLLRRRPPPPPPEAHLPAVRERVGRAVDAAAASRPDLADSCEPAKRILRGIAAESALRICERAAFASPGVARPAAADPAALWRVLAEEVKGLLLGLLTPAEAEPDAQSNASPRSIASDLWLSPGEVHSPRRTPASPIRRASPPRERDGRSLEVLLKQRPDGGPFLVERAPAVQISFAEPDEEPAVTGWAERLQASKTFVPTAFNALGLYKPLTRFEAELNDALRVEAEQGPMLRQAVEQVVIETLIPCMVESTLSVVHEGLGSTTDGLLLADARAVDGPTPVLDMVNRVRFAVDSLLPLQAELPFAADSIRHGAISVVSALVQRLFDVLCRSADAVSAGSLVLPAAKAALRMAGRRQEGSFFDSDLQTWLELCDACLGSGPVSGPAAVTTAWAERCQKDAHKRRLQFFESYHQIANMACISHSANWLAERIGVISRAAGESPQNQPSQIAMLSDRLQAVSHAALCTLHADLYARCFAMLDAGGSDISYSRVNDTVEPDAFVGAFNREIRRLHSVLGEYLPPARRHRLFASVPHLVASLMTGSIKQLRCRQVTHPGFAQLKRNTYSIQQNLSLLVGGERTADSKDSDPFSRTRQYFGLMRVHPTDLVEVVREQLQGVGAADMRPFAPDEYSAVVESVFASQHLIVPRGGAEVSEWSAVHSRVAEGGPELILKSIAKLVMQHEESPAPSSPAPQAADASPRARRRLSRGLSTSAMSPRARHVRNLSLGVSQSPSLSVGSPVRSRGSPTSGEVSPTAGLGRTSPFYHRSPQPD
eukprot:TRINITY_DN5265_c1_g3_i1.p1 TRINITY_DN5265_c1_g3~~TRINITY_DN5265_c1_g3_i1.p1  ORF type:complete len:1520 (+),score=605.84 TRINITY_DN5265_c1_g3_i1:67-4560(+)